MKITLQFLANGMSRILQVIRPSEGQQSLYGQVVCGSYVSRSLETAPETLEFAYRFDQRSILLWKAIITPSSHMDKLVAARRTPLVVRLL